MFTMYGQRQLPWATMKLGKSLCTCGRYGCTSCCIVNGRNFLLGLNETPDKVISKINYTADGLILWGSLPNIGLRLVSRIYGRNDAAIQQALSDPSKFVIIQVENDHWLWVIGRKLPLLGWRCFDPWFADKCYSNRYKNITGCAIIGKA